MKGIGKIITISLLVVLLLVVGVLSYHSMFGSSKAFEERPMYQIPSYKPSVQKPEKGLNDQVISTGTLTDDNLLMELEKTVDDGGQAELEQLKQEAAGL